jgi:DNA-binding cell septation regulator SpoVG
MSRKTEIRVSDIRFTATPFEMAAGGLLGFVSVLINGRIRLSGITVRRTLSGRKCLSFPARRDAAGREHPLIQPIDDEARCEIEAQVLRALGHEVDE